MFLKSNGNNGMIGAFPKTPLEFGFGNDRALSIKKEADYIARITDYVEDETTREKILGKNAQELLKM